MEESTPIVKKTTRTRKTAAQLTPMPVDTQSKVDSSVTPSAAVSQVFDELMTKLIQSKQEFDNLQKEITQMKQDWVREQKQYELELSQQKNQQELERKRDRETYEYATTLTRKRAEDEFQDKKMSWEKELMQRKEELEAQRKELESLRKQVLEFDSQKGQAVREAQAQLEKELTEKYENDKKLREQEIKSEKEILDLKIANLEAENSRFNKEMEVLKRSLDEATRQVKEIAVKVIESGSSQAKTQTTSEP